MTFRFVLCQRIFPASAHRRCLPDCMPFGYRDPYYALLRKRSVSLLCGKTFRKNDKTARGIMFVVSRVRSDFSLMMRCWGANHGPEDIATTAFRFIASRTIWLWQARHRYPRELLFRNQTRGCRDDFRGGYSRHRCSIRNPHWSCHDYIGLYCLEDDLDLHTEAQFRARTADDQEFDLKFTVSSLQPTIEGIEIECGDIALSYPLPRAGICIDRGR